MKRISREDREVASELVKLIKESRISFEVFGNSGSIKKGSKVISKLPMFLPREQNSRSIYSR